MMTTMPTPDHDHRRTSHHKPAGPAAMPRVLGVDPGLRRTGYAIVSGASRTAPLTIHDAGIIRLDPRHSLADRLVELEANLAELVTRYQPARLVCEQLYAHYRHPRTAILMGHARGVILCLARRHDLQVLDIAATQVKKLLTGSGRAGKPQMQRAVAALLGLATLPEPHDVADALAIAVGGLEMSDATSALAGAATTTAANGVARA